MGLSKAMYTSREYERPPTFDLVKLSQIFEIPPELKQAAAPKLHTASRQARARPDLGRTAAARARRRKDPRAERAENRCADPAPAGCSAGAFGRTARPGDRGSGVDRQRLRSGNDRRSAGLSKKVEPFYPEFVKDQGISGVVRAQVTIDEKGNVMEVKILNSPHELLTDEVMKAVSRWKYKPGKFKGVAVKVRNRPIEIEFRLD